jgi:phosphate starvation-inducible PhoH-like protein
VQIEGSAEAAARAREVLHRPLQPRRSSGEDIDAGLVDAVIAMSAEPMLDGIIRQDVAAAPPADHDPHAQEDDRAALGDAGALHAALRRNDMIFALGPGGHRQDLSRGRAGGAQLITGSVDSG